MHDSASSFCLKNSAGNGMLTQSSLGGTNGAQDGFGASLAAGKIAGQATDTLAIGAPNDQNPTLDGPLVRTGAVYVVQYGLVGSSVVAHDSTRLYRKTTDGAQFGGALAVGDLDDDGIADLAVGAPHHLDQGARFVPEKA